MFKKELLVRDKLEAIKRDSYIKNRDLEISIRKIEEKYNFKLYFNALEKNLNKDNK